MKTTWKKFNSAFVAVYLNYLQLIFKRLFVFRFSTLTWTLFSVLLFFFRFSSSCFFRFLNSSLFRFSKMSFSRSASILFHVVISKTSLKKKRVNFLNISESVNFFRDVKMSDNDTKIKNAIKEYRLLRYENLQSIRD